MASMGLLFTPSTCRQASVLVMLVSAIVIISRRSRPMYAHDDLWVPCANFDCTVAADLANAPLQAVKTRKLTPGMHIEADYNVFKAVNNRTIALEQVYFDIPKTIHQIWVGKQPPPRAWIDTWRYQPQPLP